MEFQKAQCFFAIAVEVAAQILAPVGSLGANNLGQLFTTYEFIRITSIHGSLPITFALLCLRRAGIRSWYLFTLSACAVTLSAATYGSVNKFEQKINMDPKAFSLPSTTAPLIETCGGLNPSAWCDNSQDFALVNISTTGLGSLISSGFVLGLMLLDQYGFADLPFIQNFLNRFAGLSSRRITRVLPEVVFFLIWCNYLIWFVFGCINLVSFMQAGAIDKSTWGFGQIVAVTIWVPCLFEYFHLEIRESASSATKKVNWLTPNHVGGIENVFQLRLGQYYKVVKVAHGDLNPNNTFISGWNALQNLRKFKFKTRNPSGYTSVDSLALAEYPLDNRAQQHPRAS